MPAPVQGDIHAASDNSACLRPRYFFGRLSVSLSVSLLSVSLQSCLPLRLSESWPSLELSESLLELLSSVLELLSSRDDELLSSRYFEESSPW